MPMLPMHTIPIKTMRALARRAKARRLRPPLSFAAVPHPKRASPHGNKAPKRMALRSSP